MTHMKYTCNKIKLFAAAFWLSILVSSAFIAPMFLIPVSLLAMFHFAYLMINPVPLPIVLSFVCTVSLSIYTIVMNITPLS